MLVSTPSINYWRVAFCIKLCFELLTKPEGRVRFYLFSIALDRSIEKELALSLLIVLEAVIGETLPKVSDVSQ